MKKSFVITNTDQFLSVVQKIDALLFDEGELLITVASCRRGDKLRAKYRTVVRLVAQKTGQDEDSIHGLYKKMFQVESTAREQITDDDFSYYLDRVIAEANSEHEVGV